METINIQVAFFLKEDYNKPIEKLSLNIQDVLGQPERLNYIPIDNSAPSELPRLEIIYKNYKVQASKNRIDLYLDSIDNYAEKIDFFNNIDYSSLGIQIRRIGFVRSYFIVKEVVNSKKLLNAEFQEIDIKEFNLRINIEKEVLGRKCNNIEQIEFGDIIKLQPGGQQKVENGCIVRRDINTLNEILYELVKDERKSLIDKFIILSEEFTFKNKLD
ncbi:hypothetical protein ACYE2N_11470 [Flavobacterium sp. MAHUQ-51]|uniref:hypothetical protein n=1 Tax=Flavobacterium sp. GCM10022190 TaxID=3252639 RepID=UPI00361EDD9C